MCVLILIERNFRLSKIADTNPDMLAAPAPIYRQSTISLTELRYSMHCVEWHAHMCVCAEQCCASRTICERSRQVNQIIYLITVD